MNWKEDMREKVIRFAIEVDDKIEKQAEADDDFNNMIKSSCFIYCR